MKVMAIHRGTLVEAVTASGKTVHMRALGEPTEGRDFPVVWVCTEEEFTQDEDRDEVQGIPWPRDAIRELPSRSDDGITEIR